MPQPETRPCASTRARTSVEISPCAGDGDTDPAQSMRARMPIRLAAQAPQLSAPNGLAQRSGPMQPLAFRARGSSCRARGAIGVLSRLLTPVYSVAKFGRRSSTFIDAPAMRQRSGVAWGGRRFGRPKTGDAITIPSMFYYQSCAQDAMAEAVTCSARIWAALGMPPSPQALQR